MNPFTVLLVVQVKTVGNGFFCQLITQEPILYWIFRGISKKPRPKANALLSSSNFFTNLILCFLCWTEWRSKNNPELRPKMMMQTIFAKVLY